MFKVYCHMSSLIQCSILLPLNPINNKKKDMLFSRPRARETQEYTFAKQQYPPYFPHLLLHITSFYPPLSRIDVTRHFILNSFGFAPTSFLLGLRPPTSLATSLASSLFFYSPCSGSNILASLKHLNKP
jgi:hypothetical protein